MHETLTFVSAIRIITIMIGIPIVGSFLVLRDNFTSKLFNIWFIALLVLTVLESHIRQM